jgi:hypothetical protein
VQGGVGLGGSGVGEISGALVAVEAVAVGAASVPGVAVEKATLIAAVGETFWLEGGMNSVGVTVGPQAASRHKNTQYEIQSLYRVLRILGFMVD